MKRRKTHFSVDDTINNFLGRPVRKIAIAIMLISVLFPLYWLASNSVKMESEYLRNPPVMVPSQVTFDNYRSVFSESGAGRSLFNTVVISVCTTVACVSLGSMAGYAIAKGKMNKKLRSGFSLWYMIQKMYPAVCIAIPIYLVMREVKLIDTQLGLIIVNTSFNLPLTTWLMIGFFQDMPEEMEQAGVIDGCNMFQRFFLLALPINKPGLIAAAILTFNSTWNEFLFACILSINKSKTLPVVLAGFMTDRGLEWGPMAALSMVLIIPVVILV